MYLVHSGHDYDPMGCTYRQGRRDSNNPRAGYDIRRKSVSLPNLGEWTLPIRVYRLLRSVINVLLSLT